MTLGRRHPLVLRMRSLRHRAGRRVDENLFLAEGLHLAEAALSAGARIEAAVFSAALAAKPEGRDLLRRVVESGAPCHEASADLLASLQDARSPQPLLTLVRRDPPQPIAGPCQEDEAHLIVVAYGVQDPGNLGSMIRSADAAGATGFVVSGESAAAHHPRCVRATMGSIFRVPVWTLSVSAAVERLREAGMRLLATAPGRGQDYRRCEFREPTALVFGGEGGGLPDELLDMLDATVRIPLRAGVESLSVGAAAAVLLFEARRQREEWDRETPIRGG